MTNKECNTQNDHLNFVINFLTLKNEDDLMIKLKVNNKVITLHTHELNGQTYYKAQDLLLNYFNQDSKAASRAIDSWMKKLKVRLGVMDAVTRKTIVPKNEVKIKLRQNGVLAKTGGNDKTTNGTYLNKINMLKLAGYVSQEFEFAVYKAFSLLTEGETQEAQNLAGSLCIDLKVAEEVDKSWKAFCNWTHATFKTVHPSYGSNFTKLVIKKSLGVSKTTNIRGKVDNGVVQKLIEQNHGDAILALRATIKLCSKFFNQKHIKELMKTYEGKMETYQMLSDFLTFE